jgi:alkylhydroperoxidase family enzyme
MQAARIAPLDAPYAPATQQTFDRIMPPGMAPLALFRTMAHSPRVLQRVFAGNLLDPGAITLRERELIILRTCARCGCNYEWGVHAALFAHAAELSDADIAATQADGGGNLLLRAVDELHASASITDATWQELAAQYQPDQLLEIVALAGYYHTISFIANACRVAPEPFAREPQEPAM